MSITQTVRELPHRAGAAILIALAAFAAITVGRFAVANPAEAIAYLYVLPIALVAMRFGAATGAAAGGLALALTAVWAETRAVDIGAIGYSVRGLIFVGIGATVAELVRERDDVEHEVGRWFAMSNDLLCVAGSDGRLTRVNAAWEELLGYRPEELLSRRVDDLVHPGDAERTARAAATLASTSTLSGFENRYRARDGSWRWLLWSARFDGQRVYAVAKDITERKQLEHEREELIARLNESARTDELTGLPNLRAWKERFADETQRARRSGESLSVAVIDLDDFKTVNDSRGHAAGDRLLREVAAAWRGALRETDYLGRLGGDEFGVILPGYRHPDGGLVERLHAAMPPNSAASIGVAEWDGVEPLDELVARADRALYRAKRARWARRP